MASLRARHFRVPPSFLLLSPLIGETNVKVMSRQTTKEQSVTIAHTNPSNSTAATKHKRSVRLVLTPLLALASFMFTLTPFTEHSLQDVPLIGEAVETRPAAADSQSSTVIVPTWWGWCPGRSNKVTYLAVTLLNYHGGTRIASGRDSVSIRLQPAATASSWNHVNVSVFCSRSGSQARTVWIRQDRSGQKHYIGAYSGSWSN